MNERERWIVYPLLFLALGASLRDKLIDRTTSGSIVCKELIVVDEEPIGREPFFIAKIGRVQPSAAGGQTGGYLVVNGQLSVNGTVDGQNYAVQGVPLALSVRAMIADLLQALQKSTQRWEQTNPLNSQPAESDPTADAVPATESAPAESSPQGK